MRSPASRPATTLALLVCLICPLVETVDNWDHTIQTGSDTEYTLVVLALCVGAAYSFARLVFNSSPRRFVATSAFACGALKPFFPTFRRFTLLLFDATSPPSLPLRI